MFEIGIVTAKKFFKKEKKHNKRFLLAKSKLNSIENIISKALTENGCSHEDFTVIMNQEKIIVN